MRRPFMQITCSNHVIGKRFDLFSFDRRQAAQVVVLLAVGQRFQILVSLPLRDTDVFDIAVARHLYGLLFIDFLSVVKLIPDYLSVLFDQRDNDFCVGLAFGDFFSSPS